VFIAESYHFCFPLCCYKQHQNKNASFLQNPSYCRRRRCISACVPAIQPGCRQYQYFNTSSSQNCWSERNSSLDEQHRASQPLQITCCTKTDGLSSTPHTQACIMALIAHTGITSCQVPSPNTTYTMISSQACPQTCGQDAGGPTWTFGTGELLGIAQTLIGLVQAILQAMTLPTIALHSMMHGRRHAHQHP
jgi:hypothetical protein